MSIGDFSKVCKDFVTDLLSTFPELEKDMDASLKDLLTQSNEESLNRVFEYVKEKWPVYFFDIMGEKAVMFEKECLLLPGVDFNILWALNITENTKKVIWKYLKLILLTVVGGMKDSEKMFEGMCTDEVRQKMEEATKDIHDFFKDMPIPNNETLHEHIQGMMTGKLGQLAKEVADETVGQDVTTEKMEEMMKNPSKLIGLVQTVGDKIDSKIKKGELKESELLEEASEMLKKMKDLPGLDQLFKKFAGGGKMDMSGMQSKLNQNMKAAKTKERLQQKLKERKTAETTETPPVEQEVEKSKEKEKEKEKEKKKKKKGKK